MIKCYCGHTITCDCEVEQETLEEIAKKYIEESNVEYYISIEDFMMVAKWQKYLDQMEKETHKGNNNLNK